MTVLITGVGLVGSQVARTLVERGEAPILMDVAPQMEALGQIVDLDKVTVVRGDVLKPFQLTNVIREHQVTHIAHTVANPLLTVGAQDNPYAAIELNIMGTVNVLEAARVSGVERVVASSGNIVAMHVDGGEGNGNPAVEEAFPRPVTFYSATKQAVENIGLNYARANLVDFAAVRYAVVAGPWGGRGGGGPTLLFRDMIINALAGDEVVVPHISFEWVYVEDAAEGTVLTLLAPELKSRVFNITMGTLVSQNDLADAVTAAVPGANIRLQEASNEKSVIPNTHLASDISLAKEALGFTPRYGIKEAVQAMVDWHRKFGATSN